MTVERRRKEGHRQEEEKEGLSAGGGERSALGRWRRKEGVFIYIY